MQPHLLRLRGFRGIRDGLRREELTLDLDRLSGDAALVALTGGNGRGKTTILDNLHPYLALPSRVASVAAAGFSYYDHVYLPESEKELIWSQGRSRYRTHIVIRSSGRRRTEAFLFVEDGERWVPATLPDGTLSDGKVETYTALGRVWYLDIQNLAVPWNPIPRSKSCRPSIGAIWKERNPSSSSRKWGRKV